MNNFVLGVVFCMGVSLLAFNTYAAVTTYKYDANGNVIERNDGSKKYVYTLDDNGKAISSLYYSNATAIANNKPSSTSTFTYEYDEYGNVIKKYANGKLYESHVYPDEYYYNQWLAHRKLQYTIEEANELTTNDNNNWVEWTFE